MGFIALFIMCLFKIRWQNKGSYLSEVATAVLIMERS